MAHLNDFAISILILNFAVCKTQLKVLYIFNKKMYHTAMRYKAIFCDFDGTLYREDHTISQVNKRAIKEFTQAGGKFVISTGRLFSAIYPKLEELGLDGDVIVYQGGGIFDIKSKKQIFGRFFDKKDTIEVLKYVESLGEDYTPIVYINDTCHCMERNEAVDVFVGICAIGFNETHRLLSQFVEESVDLPVKVVVLADDIHCQKLVKEGQKKFPHLAIMRSHQLVVEAITKGINKGEAVKWLCNKYGISTDEAIAMGDSENDIEMIKAAGLGIAVGNAMPNVKLAADYIADTNDNDAVAKVIYEFCLTDK